MPDNSEYRRVMTILQQNANKGFVQRILKPDEYPTLDLGNGDYATHKMAWIEDNGKYRVFPTVLYDGKALTQYEPMDAYRRVQKTGNFIDFNSPDEADWFSQRYKAAWGQ